MGFKIIYWTPMSGLYFLYGSTLEKYGNLWKNGRFSGRIWPDWGNTAWADMAGLGTIGLSSVFYNKGFSDLKVVEIDIFESPSKENEMQSSAMQTFNGNKHDSNNCPLLPNTKAD